MILRISGLRRPSLRRVRPGIGLLALCLLCAYPRQILAHKLEGSQYRYSPPSPQTWEFVKYGNTPVDLYTGTARVDIPLYTYSDDDFTIPVSLGYASGGFMPAQQTGIVGLNWFLNAGGTITREVRGLDDFEGRSNSGVLGFLVNSSIKVDDAALLARSVTTHSDFIYSNVNNVHVEAEPDIFHFSFMGHSGTFHYNGQRKPVVYNTNGNHGTYGIVYAKSYNGYPYFIIKTADGYEYTFGGQDARDGDNYFERSMEGAIEDRGDMRFYFNPNPRAHPIVTWMLKQIKAPNGRRVCFTYRNGEMNYGTYLDGQQYPNYIVTFTKSGGYKPNAFTKLFKKPNLLKTTYLAKINIDDKAEMNFHYSGKDAVEVLPGTDPVRQFYTGMVQKLLKLDSLCVTRRNADGSMTSLPTSRMGYTTVDNRLLLDKVHIEELGQYRMEYYLGTTPKPTFPDLLDNGLDFWGYANGRSMADNSAYSGTQADGFDEYIAPNSAKKPDADKSIRGNLKRIVYPTGGSSLFEYEGHTAEYAVLKRYNAASSGGNIEDEERPAGPPALVEDPTAGSSCMVRRCNFSVLKTGDNKVGGVRIRRIADSDNRGRSTIRLFEYADSFGHSSGILLQFPRYIGYRYITYGDTVSVIFPHIQSSRNTFDKTHIEYSKVTERQTGGTEIEYNYTSYIDKADKYSGQNYATLHHAMIIGNMPADIYNGILREPNSLHNQRGKLTSTIHYDAAGKPVRKQINTYEVHNERKAVNYSTTIIGSGQLAWSKKIYTGDDRLVKTEVTDYGNKNNGTVVTKYGYNALGQLCRTAVSDGVAIRTDSVVYVGVEAHSTPELRMKYYTHQLDAPIERLQMRRYDGVDYMVGGSRYTYKLEYDTIPCLSAVERYEVDLPKALTADRTVADKTTYDVYDTKGRLLQTTDPSEVVTSYLWGYGGLYVVAVIKNATIRQIENAGLSSIRHTPLPAGAQAFETALRAIPGAQVTTYEYDPFLGVSAVRDISGRRTTYSYDIQGRLKEVRDDAGNPIVLHDYSIRP